MVACAETLTAEDKVKGPFAHTDLRAGDNNIPNGTTDACWLGWQTMEERNSSNTATCQYVWGTYVDECIQINLLQPAGPQQLAIGVYYPLQDTLYRTMALANSSGTPVEAYDTDAYGNTIIFTGPGADNTWFTDDDAQATYGANNIIFCGYLYDPESLDYYVRSRFYAPHLGRWLTPDPIGYRGGINLYGYVNSSPVGNVDAEGVGPNPEGAPPAQMPQGEVADIRTLQSQVAAWNRAGYTFASALLQTFLSQRFPGRQAGAAFERFSSEIKSSEYYRSAARSSIAGAVRRYYTAHRAAFAPGKWVRFPLPTGMHFYLRYYFDFADRSRLADDLMYALGGAVFNMKGEVKARVDCDQVLHWTTVRLSVEQPDDYSFPSYGDPIKELLAWSSPAFRAAYALQHTYGFQPFSHTEEWSDQFHGEFYATWQAWLRAVAHLLP